MISMKKLAAGAATTAIALAMASTVYAQETTGGVNGAVTDAAGKGLANVQVVITYKPTNASRTLTTDAAGRFSARGLQPGGPYSIVASDATHEAKTLDVPGIDLGSAYQANLTLGDTGPTVAEVTVVSSKGRVRNTLQTGPRSTFTAADIATLPSFSRDLKDIARLNPFVTLDPTNNNALIIGGNNPRYNAIYIDGVRESDDFGLNSNGYPTQRSPLSVDLVKSFNVEVAPYDVQYGSFQGGVLNIATKDGGNTFHGSAFYEYDSDGLGAGKEIRDRPAALKFQDKNYGVTIGGPIVQDKLFFEFGYEKYQGLAAASFGPGDSAATNRVTGTTIALATQIQNDLINLYGYNQVGTYGTSQPVQDEKFFGKLTWQINEHHRFVFEAQSDAGTTFNQPNSSATKLGLGSSTYLFSQPLLAFTGFLYSNWAPNFTTEISYTHRETDGLTINPGGDNFANFNIFLNGTATATGAVPTINVGPDVSRQENVLLTTDQNFRIKGNYTLGNHTITAGYERDQLDVFNAFVQNSNGAYTFTNITQLEAKQAFSLTYANAADNVKADGAANWGDVNHSFYLQDEWRPLTSLTLRAGVRAELYEQGSKPKLNPTFQKNYGFSNQSNLDGLSQVMPRVGFNWKPEPTLTVFGGAGMFSGGNPNVWLSNNFSNTGNILGSVNCTLAVTSPCPQSALQNVNGLVIPDSVKALNTASANAGLGITNELDPKFELLSVWKGSVGFSKVFNFTEIPYTSFVGQFVGDGWNLHGDYVYQKTNKGVQWVDLALKGQQIGTAPDGRPIYNPTRFSTAPNLIGRNNEYDLLLTNTDKGGGFYWDIGLGKTWVSTGWGFDFTYTHTRMTEISPGTSSVALSNYRQSAFSDPNNPPLAISSYNIKDQLKLRVSYDHEFFPGVMTHMNLYGQRRSGLPFSYTFNSTSNGLVDSAFGLTSAVAANQELLYVPKMDATGNITATSDPKVSYQSSSGLTPDQLAAQVNAFVKQTGLSKYNGSITPRNVFTSRDVTTVDFEIQQEIPAFFPHAAKAQVYFQIFNLGNMINNSWGVLDQYAFPGTVSVLSLGAPAAGTTPAIPALVSCTGNATCAPGQVNQYRVTALTPRTPTINTAGQPPASTWALKVGVRYQF